MLRFDVVGLKSLHDEDTDKGLFSEIYEIE